MKSTTKMILVAMIGMLVIPGLALAGTATLHWQANTEPDLAGYRIYYGASSRTYGAPISVDKDTTNYTFNNLSEGRTYYFALTAIDTSGNESGFSEEVSKTIAAPPAPSPPPPPPAPPEPAPAPPPPEPTPTPGSDPSPEPEPSQVVPRVDIKVNGKDWLQIMSGTSHVKVSVSVDKGDYGDQIADWWVYANTSLGTYSYVYGRGWLPGIHRSYKGRILDIASLEVLNITLPPGTYRFIFSVDDNADGIMDNTWKDSVVVLVTR